MRLHVLQHVPFEDAANIGVWAEQREFAVTCTRFFLREPLPDPGAMDALVIMGGPMNIYEHARYPWLIREKQFIKTVIDAGRTVVGICLGGQLVCDVLGGQVTRNTRPEIGWFPVALTEEGQQEGSLLSILPTPFQAFHWHGDTFSIPPGARHLAVSEACKHQAFQYGDRVLAMQFHLDYSEQSIQTMIEHCSGELQPGPFVQADPEILVDFTKAQILQAHLLTLLEFLLMRMG